MSLYTPGHFVAHEREAIARLMRDNPFATLVTPALPEPWITHAPLLHVADREPHGSLLGHVARANPHWRHMGGVQSIAVFHGPHAYISPSWYVAPSQAVPTWNFAAVHVAGGIELIEDPAETRGVLDLLVARFEGGRPEPWRFTMPAPQRDAMVGAIVAFRLVIQRIDAKFKLSQNRPSDDRARVIAALQAEPYPESAATAAWMATYADPNGGSRTS